MGRPVRRTQTERKSSRRNRSKEGYGEYLRIERSVEDKLVPMNDNQRKLISSIKSNVLTFATGVAGTGKTFCAIVLGCQMLRAGLIDRIVCVKPDVAIDSVLGTLPGDKDEKLAVLYNPMVQIFKKTLGSSYFENLVKSEKIVFEHLGSILGITYDDSLVIMDEAQNSTPAQMKILLTRIGQRSKVVLSGDYKDQAFISGVSGLEDALYRLGRKDGVGMVNFLPSDIVRSDFTKTVILAYREDDEMSYEDH